MKPILIPLWLLGLALGQVPSALAQGTAFTYQGSLTDSGSPANGSYDMQFCLRDAASGGSSVGGTNTITSVAISNGLFTVTLDFGSVFDGNPRWLLIGVRTNAGGFFTALNPLQALQPAPYAMFANTSSNLSGTLPAAQLSGTIPSADISGTYGNQVTLNNPGNVFTGSFNGNGAGLSNVWLTGGNAGTVPGPNFLGTTDNQPLELRVNGYRAWRLEPDTRGFNAPNLIGGHPNNRIEQPGSGGDFLGGGGLSTAPNVIRSNSSGVFIGAGSLNQAGPNVNDAVIAGGYANTILSPDSVIAGGFDNAIGGNAGFSTIAGGDENALETNCLYSVIGGGAFNTIQNGSPAAAIAGGESNTVGTNAYYAAIGGGLGNTIQSNAFASTIAGGDGNTVGLNSAYSVIGGGDNNRVSNAWAVVAGGYFNTNNGLVAFIGAGDYNLIGSGGTYSFVGGGYHNVNNGDDSFVGGGADNSISAVNYAVITGGDANSVDSSGATIVGGSGNSIQTNEVYAFIGGGAGNYITLGSSVSVIGGGYLNQIVGSGYSVVGGGLENILQTNSGYSFVGGGYDNQILVGASFGTIGGGTSNRVGGPGASVPGGMGNNALGINSLAAGTHAQATHDGAFVLTDLQYTNFYSIASNQLSGRFSGGVAFVTSGAGMTLDGQPVLAGVVPSAELSGTYPNAVTFNNPGNSFTGNGTGLANVNSATLGGMASSNFWKTTGNAGTTPGANFLGTTDNRALLLRGSFVGIGRATQITADEFFGVDAPVGAGTYGGMYINTTNATGKPFYGYAQSGAGVAYHYVDGNDANKWKLNLNGDRLVVTTAGNVGIGNTSPTNLLMVNNARCDGGTWINASDRNLKENFAAVNQRQILDQVLQLPVSRWNYKSDPNSAHLGPVAQDFHTAFNLGQDELSIATVDESGVALAAIQGLNEKVEHRLKQKDEEIEQLKASVTRLKELVNELAARQAGDR